MIVGKCAAGPAGVYKSPRMTSSPLLQLNSDRLTDMLPLSINNHIPCSSLSGNLSLCICPDAPESEFTYANSPAGCKLMQQQPPQVLLSDQILHRKLYHGGAADIAVADKEDADW